MSGAVPAGLGVGTPGWYPADGEVAKLGVGEGAPIAQAARRLLDGGRPCGPEPRSTRRPRMDVVVDSRGRVHGVGDFGRQMA